ncbi:MAG: hypothetical protein HY043_17000 [Verrucomicrobia bacterium]|nr:hypothetical protein [Verrucomicrobiota bacterium]
MRATTIITVSVLVLLGAAFAVHRHVDRTYVQPSQELSKMMSVRMTIAEALSAHHKQHGSFPRLLSELPLQTLRWGDEGSSARDLDSWHYSSEGHSFSMTWTNARGSELFLAGRNGQLFYSRDDAR